MPKFKVEDRPQKEVKSCSTCKQFNHINIKGHIISYFINKVYSMGNWSLLILTSKAMPIQDSGYALKGRRLSSGGSHCAHAWDNWGLS